MMIRQSLFRNRMSRGIKVSLIQKDNVDSWEKTNSIPPSGARKSRLESPTRRSSEVTASSKMKVCPPMVACTVPSGGSAVGATVEVGSGVGVFAGVAVGTVVTVGGSIAEGLGVGVGARVAVGSGVLVGIGVATGLGKAVGLAVAVGPAVAESLGASVGGRVGVGPGVGSPRPSTGPQAEAATAVIAKSTARTIAARFASSILKRGISGTGLAVPGDGNFC